MPAPLLLPELFDDAILTLLCKMDIYSGTLLELMDNLNFSVTPSPLVLRLFVVSWAVMLCVAAWFVQQYFPDSSAWLWLLVSALVFLLGLVRPVIVSPLYLLIDRLLSPIGKLTSLMVLAVVYYLVFSLFALVLKLFKWDPLQIKAVEKRGSGWVETNKQGVDVDYFWQY